VRPAVWVLIGVIVAVSAGLLYLSSDSFERRVERLLEETATEALGRTVTVEDLDLSLLSLGVEVLDLRIAGPTPEDPPVLTSKRVAVDLSILDLDLWGGKGTALRLEQLILEEPRFELAYDDAGLSNLPDLPVGDGEGGGGVEIHLGRLLVQRGVFVYDDQRVPLHLDAQDLWGQLEGAAPGPASPYRFRLSARSLDTRLPATAPVAPAVSLEAFLYPDRIELTEGRLAAASTEEPELFQADLSGVIRWRETAEVSLDIEARASAGWANRLGYLEEPIAGPVRFEGQFLWTPEDWRYGGELRSQHLELLDRRVADLRAELVGGADEVRVEVTGARHAGGILRGSLVLDLSSAPDPRGGRPARIDAVGESLALRELLDGFGLELAGVAGSVTARLDYRFSTGDVWRGDGEGRVAIQRLRRPSDRQSVRGEAPVSIRGGILTVAGARLAASAQSANFDLTYDLERRTGALRYRLDSESLPELAGWLQEPLGATVGESPPLWWPTEGRGTVEGTTDLLPDLILGRMTFQLDDVAASDLRVDRLEGSFEHGPQRISDLEARAERGGGELWVTGEVAWAGAFEAAGGSPEGSLASGSPRMDLQVGAAGWPLSSLEPLLAAAPEMEGGLNGRLEIGGSFEQPTLRGSLWAEPVRVADRVIDRAELDLDWIGRAGRIERLTLRGPPGELVASGSLDLESGAIDLQVEAPELILERSTTVSGLASRLEGALALQATVGGTLESPRAEASLRARNLSLEGRPLGRQGEADLLASWSDGELRGRGSILGLVRFEGGGRLDPTGAELRFQVHSEQVEEILALLLESPVEIAGSFAGDLGVSGSWSEGEGLRGHLELSELMLTQEGREIRNLQPVVVILGPEEIEIESLFLGNDRTGSELFVAGTIGWTGGDFPLDLRVQTSLDASWLQPVLPEVQVTGVLDALATVRGTLVAPQINGQAEIREARAILPGFPHSLEGVSAVVFFYPKELVLHQLSARFASGRVRATGRMDMPREGDPLVYELRTEARNLTVRYPEGWTLRGDGELILSAPTASGGRELGGSVRLDRVFYVQDVRLSLFQVIQGALQRQRLALQETDELLASTELSLGVEGDDALRVRNNVADLSGDISLQIRGTLARPVVFGRVELERGGRLEFRDTDYQVERGLLTFANPYEIEPVIDLEASTEVRRYDVQLVLSGTLDRLNASFSSNPPLADLEILGLLTTGVAPEEQIGQQGVAERFLFGQAASALSRRVNTLFGFDRFQISPGQGEEIGSGIGFSVEKSLSREVRVIFSRDPTSTERELLQVAWDVTEEVTLILTREGDGSFAVDARWERSF